MNILTPNEILSFRNALGYECGSGNVEKIDEDREDYSTPDDVVETAEPISNFTKANVWSYKTARYKETPYGKLMIIEGVQRTKGEERKTLYLMDFNGRTAAFLTY